MKEIYSTQNDLIKQIVTLQTPKGRETHREFIVEGLRACLGFIESGYIPTLFFITDHSIPKALHNVPRNIFIFVSPEVMQKMSATKSASGMLAVFPLPHAADPKTLTSGLVLGNSADPGNMGTLIRSCAAFGYKSVVVIGGCDPFSPKVVQASAGALALVTIFEWTWEQLLEHKKNLHLAALVAKGGKTLQQIPQENILWVVGNESRGIEQDWLPSCDYLVTLPMPGNTESLNAAVAGSLALGYQFLIKG